MKTSTDFAILAAYLRLSREDGDITEGKEESNSITNQRKLIEQYLLSHPDLAELEYTEYVDDGYTGTNTKRPAFHSIHDFKSKKRRNWLYHREGYVPLLPELSDAGRLCRTDSSYAGSTVHLHQ